MTLARDQHGQTAVEFAIAARSAVPLEPHPRIQSATAPTGSDFCVHSIALVNLTEGTQ